MRRSFRNIVSVFGYLVTSQVFNPPPATHPSLSSPSTAPRKNVSLRLSNSLHAVHRYVNRDTNDMPSPFSPLAFPQTLHLDLDYLIPERAP